ncbi:DUF3363 domain-containing protein [Xanthomonas hyacinthi]
MRPAPLRPAAAAVAADEPRPHAATRGRRRWPGQIERFNEPRLQRQRLPLIGRLQRLQRLGLADETQPGTWAVHVDAEKTCAPWASVATSDIIRTMQRAIQPCKLAVFPSAERMFPMALKCLIGRKTRLSQLLHVIHKLRITPAHPWNPVQIWPQAIAMEQA